MRIRIYVRRLEDLPGGTKPLKDQTYTARESTIAIRIARYTLGWDFKYAVRLDRASNASQTSDK